MCPFYWAVSDNAQCFKVITLRAGEKAEANALARLILSSAPVLLSYLFSGPENAVRYMSLAGGQVDGQYSAARHQVAVDGTQVVACITLWDNQLPVSFHSFTVQSLSRFLTPEQITHIVYANDIITHVFQAPLNHQLCIGHLAVLNKQKGRGIGKKLVAYAMLQAKSQHKSQLVLDVESTNDEAVSFYTGLGFILMQSNYLNLTKQTFYRMQFTL